MTTYCEGDDWNLRHFTVKLGDTFWRMGYNKANTKAEAFTIPTPKKGLESVRTVTPGHQEIWPEAYDANGVHYLHHLTQTCEST